LRNKTNGLYKLSAFNLEVSMNIAQSDIQTTWLWHFYIEYISCDCLPDLATKMLALGILYISFYHEVYTHCQVGKQSPESFPRHSTTRALAPLNFIHLDLCSPIPVPSLSGLQYFMVIIDDDNRYIWVKFLRHKSEAITRKRGPNQYKMTSFYWLWKK